MRRPELSGLDRRSGGGPSPRGFPGWRAAAALAVAVLTLLAAVGLRRLRIDDDLRALLRDADVDFALVDEVAARFGTTDRDCLVLATAPSGDLFTDGALTALRRLTGRLAAIDGVVEVRSLLDARRQGPAGALLPLIPHVGRELSPEDLAAARDRALRHPLVAGQLLSADGRAALVIARLEPAADRPPRLGELVGNVERTVAEEAAAGGPLTLALTGLPPLREEAARALRRDMLVFNSLGLGLAVILSATVARSLRSTVVACVPPFVGAVWAMGIIGLCGAPVNLLTSVVPSLALVVGTCDSIHFIEDMRRSARRGVTAVAASGNAIQRVGTACGLTSIVTAIGFLSLSAARIDAVRTFGLAAAAGAVASFLAVTLLTPLLASAPALSGLRLGRSSRRAGRLANALAAFSVRHARPVALAGCAAAAVLALAGAGLDADNRIADSLPSDAGAARALARVDREFGGALGVDVAVRWPAGLDWLDPAVLEALDAAGRVLAESGGIERSLSIATIASTLPARALGRLDPGDFSDLVDAAGRMAVVRGRVRDDGSRQLEAVYARIDDGLRGLAARHPGWRFELTGMPVVSARNIRQLVRDLGSSLLLELAVIGAVLALAFRSPLAGVVSLLPNVFPLLVIAALMVLLGRSLDPATVIVFNVCLGLAVDDTVHVLSALQRHRREGVSIGSAVRRAIAETGNAVIIGGGVLAVGFACVMASSVPALAGFGRLACAAVAAATVAELVLLPALLVVTDDWCHRRALRRDGIFGIAPAPWPAFTPERAAG